MCRRCRALLGTATRICLACAIALGSLGHITDHEPIVRYSGGAAVVPLTSVSATSDSLAPSTRFYIRPRAQ